MCKATARPHAKGAACFYPSIKSETRNMAKVISRASFVWSHMAAIFLHICFGALILWAAVSSSSLLPKATYITLVCIGVVMVTLSALSMVPVWKKYQGGIQIEDD